MHKQPPKATATDRKGRRQMHNRNEQLYRPGRPKRCSQADAAERRWTKSPWTAETRQKVEKEDYLVRCRTPRQAPAQTQPDRAQVNGALRESQ